MVFIYALINPLTKAVFYIGASKHPMQRLKQHVRESYYGNTRKEKVIKQIILSGKYVEIEILDSCLEKDAADKEQHYIDTIFLSGTKLFQSLENPFCASRIKTHATQVDWHIDTKPIHDNVRNKFFEDSLFDKGVEAGYTKREIAHAAIINNGHPFTLASRTDAESVQFPMNFFIKKKTNRSKLPQ